VFDEGFMEQNLGTTLRHNPMIRLDISQHDRKEGDRGKPLVLGVPFQEAVVNQRLCSFSEVMRDDVRFRHLRVRCVLFHSNTTNPAEGVREPAGQEFNLGSAVEGFVFDQLRSTSLACGVMSG
jgi:hypothetical protein